MSSHLLSEIEHICDHLVVIRDGGRIFSGPMADVERYQHSELVVRTDHPEDLARLLALLDQHGYPCVASDDEIRVADGRPGAQPSIGSPSGPGSRSLSSAASGRVWRPRSFA